MSLVEGTVETQYLTRDVCVKFWAFATEVENAQIVKNSSTTTCTIFHELRIIFAFTVWIPVHICMFA